jgi:hypothetical protein
MYTDKTAVENYLLTDIDSSFDSQVEEWISQISKYIDQYTNRTFAVSDESGDPEARLFEGRGGQKLLIDDCVSIDTVEIGDRYGDSFEETEDYVALPLNDTPKTAIALKNRAWPVGIHRITALWGYAVEVPADIKFAATVLVAGIINTHVKTGTAKKSESIGNYSVTYTDDKGIADYDRTLTILDTYKRFTL